MRRYTIKRIRSFVEDEGYFLLSESYVNCRNKLLFQCPKEHEYQASWNQFQRGQRCPHCAGNLLTFKNVKSFIESQNYQLLSDYYINNVTKLLVRCPKSHQYQVTWSDFRNGNRCPHCSKRTVSYQQVKNFIELQNYTLLSEQYVNNKTDILVQCDQNHRYETTWNKFQQGSRCPYCAGNVKLTYRYVKESIEQQNYKLLSKQYVGVRDHLLVQCPEGHTYKVTWNNFQQGYRCPICKNSKGEQCLYEILEQIFQGYNITKQDNLDFLGLQRVDFAIRDLKLAFEYDGEHHFRPVQFGGRSLQKAERAFKKQQQRDRKKEELLKQNDFKLIRFKYDENLSEEFLIQNLRENYDAGF